MAAGHQGPARPPPARAGHFSFVVATLDPLKLVFPNNDTMDRLTRRGADDLLIKQHRCRGQFRQDQRSFKSRIQTIMLVALIFA